MSSEYLDAPGEKISKDQLIIPKAVETFAAIERLPYYELLELRRLTDGCEAVVFNAIIEVGQKTFHDIRYSERLAVKFKPSDDEFPEVLALREDFPKVPHLNLRPEEKPRSLCLYDEEYHAVKLQWTPTLFLERIRKWLSLTAKGELHAADQPLEPLITSSSILIYDDFFSDEGAEHRFMIIERKGSDWFFKNSPNSFFPIPLKGEPQTSGIIDRQPKMLFELHDFLLRAKIDLLSILRKHLLEIKKNENDKSVANTPVVLIVYLPKKRVDSATPEAADIWAFLVKNTIKQIGVEIGIWEIIDGKIGTLVRTNIGKKGECVEIDVLNPMPFCSRELASRMNGLSEVENRDMLLIGGGALGSQVFINLIRAGYGNWTIIDDDCLLPHNLARHALPGSYIGRSKAESLADLANNIIRGSKIAKAINTDVLSSSVEKDELEKTFKESHVIVDATASIFVARYLARDVNSPVRRISIFLNPLGTDVVMLAEDEKRDIPLDCLEMQYYRYLLNEAVMKDHLKGNEGPVRYARSCRDVSSTIPQDLVALHSAICSRAIRNTISEKDASISLWKATESMSVTNYKVTVAKGLQSKIGDWTLCTDQFVLDKISKAREERLPNETGGILIGSFDTQRKIIYIADTILSPLDSEEWPTVYIRGCQGLKKQVDEIKEITAGMLDYVGEWHSHPGHWSEPSHDDLKAFEWLVEIMDMCGLPALMLIAADTKHSWYVCRMN